MTDDVLETIEETRFSRRGLLVKGGLTAAGLTALGSPATARVRRDAGADPIRLAVVTHGDTGSFWSVFKKGVDQATKRPQGPRHQHHAGLREQQRREAGRRRSTRRSRRTRT